MHGLGERVVSTRRYRALVGVSLGAVVLGGIASVTIGITPWPFLMLCAISGVVVVAPAIGWSGALWSVVAGALFVAQWVMQLNPYVGLRLDVAQIVAMTVTLLAAGLVGIVRAGPVVRYPEIRGLDTVLSIAPAAASGILLLVGGWVRGAAPLTWAMAGDAQFNTVLARIIAQDGGATAENVDVVALSQGLMAMVHLPGRADVAADDLLIHDVVRQADLWLLMVLLSSVLGGAIAARTLAGASRPIRAAAIVGATALPLSWHLTGFAFSAGFYNVGLAYLVLELVVFFWLLGARRPWLRLGVLLALATVLLGAWTPLAIIPLALAAVAGVRALRERPTHVDVVVVVVSGAQLIAFGLLFIVPVYVGSQAALSQPGGIVGLPRAAALGVAVVLAALAAGLLIGRGRSKHREFALGSLTFVAGSAAGVAFLLVQNRALENPWTYYPIKLAWIALEIALLLIWLSVWLLVSASGRRRVVGLVALGAVAISAVGIAIINPPRSGGWLGYFPIVALAVEPPETERALETLSEFAGEKVMFSEYFGDDDDLFLNQWQFQLTVRDSMEPIRSFAYRVLATPGDFCDAARTWGGDVELITADADWARQLDAACGDVLDVVIDESPGV